MKRLEGRKEYSNWHQREKFTDAELRALVNDTKRRAALAPAPAPTPENFTTVNARRAFQMLADAPV